MRQILELAVDGIAHSGEAIARHGERVVFVPYAIPGERIRAEIIEERARWARALLLDVIEPSPDRVQPPCPYFGPGGCGGCCWQHIAYLRQAELKQQIVADQLRRLGRIADPPVADMVALADPAAPEDAPGFLDYGYRNQVQFAVSGDGRLAFRRATGQNLIAIDRCLLLHPALDELLGAVDAAWPDLSGLTLRVGTNTGQGLIVLETAGEEQPELEIDLPVACVLRTPVRLQALVGAPWIEEETGGHRYRISAGSAFPANTLGANALVDLVLAYAELQSGDVVLNVRSGVGLLALPMADQDAEVIAVDASSSACEDLAFNAGSRANISLHEGAIEEVLPALRAHDQRVDVVVMDAPPAGAGPAAIRDLAAMHPRRAVCISDDAAALARDAIHWTEAGYRLVSVQPVDLLPQTSPVHTVALWVG